MDFIFHFFKKGKVSGSCYECPESNKRFKLVQKIEKRIKSIIIGYF